MRTVAALYVDATGPYRVMEGVSCWDITRDARTYAGPHPVVAHPPCERWGKYWYGGPGHERRRRGDDEGCFAAALAAVRRWGGVLEHPAHSSAWYTFGLADPPARGGWIAADWLDGLDGWTCHIEQGNYDHRAPKATWLYAVRVELPDLIWGPSGKTDGFHSPEERQRFKGTRHLERLSHRERRITPTPFAEVLVAMARTVAPRF